METVVFTTFFEIGAGIGIALFLFLILPTYFLVVRKFKPAKIRR